MIDIIEELRDALEDMTLRFERCARHAGSDLEFIQGATSSAHALLVRTAQVPCNLPFERVPVCACDPGTGDPPTQQQMKECKLRGGPCRESNEPQEPTA